MEHLHKDELEKTIVFCQTKFGAQRLADNLSKSDLPTVPIHGNKSQSQRERALKTFKTNAVNIMVATDVAARGLDISNVSHVINFDAPKAMMTMYTESVERVVAARRARPLRLCKNEGPRPNPSYHPALLLLLAVRRMATQNLVLCAVASPPRSSAKIH